jgi:FAD/FMN-containing dehydrogenase
MIDPTVLARFRSALPSGRVIDDPDLVAPWTSDWRSKYHGAAAAILAPRSTEEVATMLALATELGVPVVPQGGNTSMVGGATPPSDGRALILSLRGLNSIRSIDADANIAVCEAGVILEHLHDAARQQGRRFPLSLGARGAATIGGLISTNAGGTQVLRHGTMRALVEGLEVVLPDGAILNDLSALKKDNRGSDLKQLFIGAEGTLGIVTAASLRLVAASTSRSVAWAGVDSPHAALALLRHMETRLSDAIEGFEILATDVLDAVLDAIPGSRMPLGSNSPWHVLIEAVTAQGQDGSALTAAMEDALATAAETGLISDATIAASESQAEDFWRLRESASIGEKAKGPALQYDVSVPIAAMPDFMINAAASCERTFPGSSASSYGHLGDGNIHFHVRPPRDAGDRGSAWVETMGETVSRHVNDMVVAMGGSISAEHGIGQMKIGELARLSSPARLEAMRALKRAFDPSGIMNPGKLVPLASNA